MLLTPASAGASSDIVRCAEPGVGGRTFEMACIYTNGATKLLLTMRGDVETAAGELVAKARTIEVRRDNALIQTLSLPGAEMWFGQLAHFALIGIDLDFDGHADLQLATSSPSAGSGLDKAFWLYDPARQVFVRRGDLDMPLSGDDLIADPETKTLGVSARSGCCDWRTTRYQWKDGGLVRMSETIVRQSH